MPSVASMRSLSLLLVLVSALAESRPADACSAPLCWPGGFVPGDGTTIPQNAPGLYWRPVRNLSTGTAPDPASVTLTTLADPSTALPFTATALPGGDYVIVPDQPLVEGTTYVLEDLATCGGAPGPRVTFTAGPSAPLPTSLGTVSTDPHGLRGELEVATASGSCSTTIDAVSMSISLLPSTDAAPWMSLLLFETVVDDQPWKIQSSINFPPPPGGSWRGRGRDLVFRTCTPNLDASYPGMAPGGHPVAFRASLPNMQPISTPDLNVELMCDSITDPDPTDPSDDSGGCTSTTPTSSSLLLVAFAVLLRRRRDH